MIVAQGERSAIDTYQEYRKKYRDQKHRESIYRELEKLTKSGILRKYYDSEKKELVYRLSSEKLSIDLNKGIVTLT